MELICLAIMAMMLVMVIITASLLKEKKRQIKWLQDRLIDMGDKDYEKFTR